MIFLNTFARCLLTCFVLCSGTARSSDTNDTTPASAKHLQTTSLLTCMDNSQLTASFFDVKFYPDNNTVIFDIDATTTLNGNVTVKAELLTYGLKVLDKTFDLCSLGQVSLCPLSAGRIDVMSTQVIESSITKQFPGIAYTIPDLDAQVRVVAYAQNDTDFETPLACVQAILSNGKTVQTKYAAWPIAAISGVGVLTSGFVSVIGYSATAAHIASNSISLFIYFQNLAITAMMGVSRVPPIAAAWTQNFQWSMGIINTNFMQKIFDWYVQATNGVSNVVVANKDVLSIGVQKRAISMASSSDYNFDTILDDSNLYTTSEKDPSNYSAKILVLRGIERVAYLANIELSNFFLTGIVFFLFFLFVVVVSLIFFKALLEVLTRARILKETSNFFQYRKNWGSIIKGTLFRLSIIAFPQVSLLAIWEFTQVNSPAIVVDAVVILLIITGLLVYGTIRVFIKGRESLRLYKNPAYLLYSDTYFLNKFGFLYVQFKADKFWWLLPLLSYAFLRSLFVAVLQNQGKAQAMIIFVIELAYFVCLCWIRPYLDKRTNVFNIAIHLVNLINAFFFLFFSNLFKQPAVVSSVMAVILFVLNAVFALFLLLFTIVTCTLALLHRNPDVRYQPMKDDRVSFIPKIQNDFDGKNKNDSELFELRKAVMDTNENEEEKMFRDDTFGKNLNANTNTARLFDDETSSSSFKQNSSPFDASEVTEQPVQPTSAVMGTGGSFLSPQYQRASSASRTNLAPNNTSTSSLMKPESSLYLGNSNKSYSHFNNNGSNENARNNNPYL
ncbi:ASN_HP2_G0000090.mRNA.1.CDS.1 [Saccharomyces cerevisiae]|nr:BGP_1a_G0000130.mRNA.1.CDS.1 [Saccharomyces cerevisiae]CAI4234416.1 BGN_3a_G0000150.mRNA.1.CDS.1 [Saccharomyces cerevisiae]CAI5228085.1 ASN_HP2_G0000090.mRNA.1.CDS.1 [Saccharomyces cerevisiae]CAI5228230.1 BFH_HP2_G0000140.mRNA.1.CDS.1 [Saccharomyces cerevisiae]CAI6378433.1 ASN_HP2_G0000090.mRNA.1.CDS.1 [Saccharomyces cerevisiae]